MIRSYWIWWSWRCGSCYRGMFFLGGWRGGRVGTGRGERGVVKVGEEVEVVGIQPTLKTVCTGVEMFRKTLDQGQAGDNIGVLLRGGKREGVGGGEGGARPVP